MTGELNETQPLPESVGAVVVEQAKPIVHELIIEESTEDASGTVPGTDPPEVKVLKIKMYRPTCACGWEHDTRFPNTTIGARDVYVGHVSTAVGWCP